MAVYRHIRSFRYLSEHVNKIQTTLLTTLLLFPSSSTYIFTYLFVFIYLLLLNFGLLFTRLSSQLRGSDTAGARPVTSREKAHKPSEKKYQQQEQHLPGNNTTVTLRRHALLIGNSPGGLLGLVKVSSNRRSRAFTANLTVGSQSQSSRRTRPRKHCRVIKIHKQNVATLKQCWILMSISTSVGVKMTSLRLGRSESFWKEVLFWFRGSWAEE